MLVTRRKGICCRRSRCRVSTAPGIAAPPAYKVPSRSSRYACGVSGLTIPARRPPYIPRMIPVPQLLAQAALLARLAAPTPYPFSVGETLRYEAKLGYFAVGTASVSVTRMVKERGANALSSPHRAKADPPAGGLAYDLNSHVGAAAFHSLRFHRRLYAGRQDRGARVYHYPDSARYREEGIPGESVPQPSRWMNWLSSTISGPLRSGLAGATACSAISRRGTIPFRCGSPGASRLPWPMAATRIVWWWRLPRGVRRCGPGLPTTSGVSRPAGAAFAVWKRHAVTYRQTGNRGVGE